MEAGRELDALVAEKVMGWVDFWGNEYMIMGYPPVEQKMGIDAERHPVPFYSTEIASAWLVVDYMWRNVPAFRALRMESAGVGYIVAFYSHENRLDRPGAFTHGDTAPHAICLAALRAVGVDLDLPA